MSIQPPIMELPIKTAESGFYRGFSVNVAVVSKIIISILAVWCIVWPIQAGIVLGTWNAIILEIFARWYIWVIAGFVVTCLGLAIWPTSARMKLGTTEDTPNSTTSRGSR